MSLPAVPVLLLVSANCVRSLADHCAPPAKAIFSICHCPVELLNQFFTVF